MAHSKLRRQIAWEAARLMYFREEVEYYRAKMKAARSVFRGWVHPADLPSNAEIRDEIQVYARMLEGDQRDHRLQTMRLEALWLMTRLEAFSPRLIGSVLTGHIRQGSDVDIHVFTDHLEAVTRVLDDEHLMYEVERKHVTKDGVPQVFTHIHVKDRAPFELTLYPRHKRSFNFTSSITGKSMERAGLSEFRTFLHSEYPDLNLDVELKRLDDQPDRFQVYESLLLPLENVQQSTTYHPEGDALYHSLQVFDRARERHPYDEEFLTAALLHDIGKAIDPETHVESALEALDGFITERTQWLIRHHMEAHLIREGSAGVRLRRRLEAHDSYEELMDLSECDRAGRQCGVPASELEEALEYLRDLAHCFQG
jgi:predicted HD phosphohydrolase